jgi:signal transduction histidine kinase
MEGEGAIDLKLYQQKKQIIIDISDTGKGMTRAVQKTVFKPGYSTKLRGWGLGLTLSKRIVEHYHQGQISVLNSAPGKGSIFRIVLPAIDK